MRAHLYQLGAALFDQPRPERHQQLRALMWHVIYRSPVDARWVQPLLEICDAHEREENLSPSYTNLFLSGSTLVRPYGSYWLEADHEPMGRTTAEIAKLMDRHGLSLEHHAGMLPDHLVAELEFMAFLAARERMEHTRATQGHLMQEHLAVWVPRFLTALRSSNPPRYYRMAALYLKEVIAWDSRRVEEPARRSIAA